MAEGSKNIMALITEALIGIALTSGLGAYYYQLINSPDKIVWNQNYNVECLSKAPDCSVGRKEIFIYRIGNKPINNVKIFVGAEPDFEISRDTISFKYYDKSILNFVKTPKDTDVQGKIVSSNDPEENLPRAYKFNINELNPAYIYKLSLEVKSKSGNPIKGWGVVQLRDENVNEYGPQELSFNDYLRLYLVEVGAFFIILVLVLIYVIYLIHNKLFSKSKEEELL